MIILRFIWLFISIFGISSFVRATEVRLTFQDEDGKRIRIESAELLLTGWGLSERHPLTHIKDELTFFLEKEWLTQYWKHRIADLSEARILLQATGFTPQLSEPFLWIYDAGNSRNRRPNKQTTIIFPENESHTVHEGEDVAFPVTFYRPRARSVVFVDDSGSPIPHVTVDAYLFWSHENHCGVMYNDFPMGKFISDTAGRIIIPQAGRSEYFFDIHPHDGHFCLQEAKRHDAYCRQKTLKLDEPETIIALHKLQRIRFSLLLKLPESLQTESFALYEQIETPCGFGAGRIGVFEHQKELSVQIYTEEVEQIWVGRNQQEGAPYQEEWKLHLEGIQDGERYLLDVRELERGGEVVPQLIQ